MANRAYLYASDTDDDQAWELPDDSEYYDSRHTIPVAWWFLLDPSDVRFVNVCSWGATWQVLRFVANRVDALDRFRARRSLLNSLIGTHLDELQLDYFVAVLSEWPGRFLLLDPDEILQDDPVEDAQLILPTLTGLKQGSLTVNEVLQGLQRFSAIIPGDRAEVSVVGYNYGPIGERIATQMQGLNQ